MDHFDGKNNFLVPLFPCWALPRLADATIVRQPRLLHDMIREKKVFLLPGGQDDDEVMIYLSIFLNGIVVTRDNFVNERDLIAKLSAKVSREWVVSGRTFKFQFLDDGSFSPTRSVP